MATYTGTADAGGNFTIGFGGNNYTSAQKVTVTATKDGNSKSVELYAPADTSGGGVIQFSGTMTNFPLNIGVVTLSAQISGIIQSHAMRANINTGNIFYSAIGLVIQGAVTEIKDYSFSDWYFARQLVLPSSLTKIGLYAFQRFGSSATIDFDIALPSSVITLSDYSFYYANMKNFDIGTGVTSIPQYCFAYTNKLTTFNFRNVTTIGDSAFNSSNLQTVALPNSVTTLGPGCFQYAKATEISVGSGVSTITSFAFNSCTLCTKFTIGVNVTSIQSTALAQLSACNELICLPITPPTIISNTLTGLKSTCAIKVPAASLTLYQTAANWSVHASKMVGV